MLINHIVFMITIFQTIKPIIVDAKEKSLNIYIFTSLKLKVIKSDNLINNPAQTFSSVNQIVCEYK